MHDTTDDPEPDFIETIDGVVRGELPLGILFGLDADDIHALADLADDLLAAGRVKDALMLYEGCARLHPLDVTLLCGYATALRHSGDAAGAQRVTELVMTLAPDDAEVSAFLVGTGMVEQA